MSVGLAIATYNRPSYLRQALYGVKRHLVDRGVVDRVYVIDDASDAPAIGELRDLSTAESWATFVTLASNRGVAHTKNVGLRLMLGEGHQWLFVSEDDVVVQSPMAVLGYIVAAVSTGLHHLAFRSHNDKDPSGFLGTPGIGGEPPVSLWQNSVGRWALYSAESLRACGLMDEVFVNAWEHVEHTMRLGEAGYTTRGMGQFADATGSDRWIREISGSHAASIISRRSDSRHNSERGIEHWRTAHPETYRWVAQIFEPQETRTIA